MHANEPQAIWLAVVALQAHADATSDPCLKGYFGKCEDMSK